MNKDISPEVCHSLIMHKEGLPFIIKHQDPELNNIVSQAYHQSGWVRQALCQQQAYYHQVYHDQTYLLQLNHILWDQQPNNLSTLQTQVLARIDQDLSYLKELNLSLNSYQANDSGEVTWALKTNKMENILLNAREIVANEVNLAAIVHGEFPIDFIPSVSQTTILGDMTAVYGNSKSTYLSAALIEVNLVLSDVTHVQDIFFPQTDANWVDYSAITHVTPIPDPISPQAIDPQFTEKFSFFFSDEITPKGLAFVHSGYAFGGHRFEERYPDGKVWGPEDCSSWLAKLTGAQILYSTIDQLFAYRLSLPEAERGYIDPNWIVASEASVMQDLYSPVIVHNPFTDIQSGQIFAFRKFADEDHSHSDGVGGHTGLVLGMRENGKVVILAYARDMPAVEGFGIQEFSWQSNDKIETMFFDIKEKHSKKLLLSQADIFTDILDIFGEANAVEKPLISQENQEVLLIVPPTTLPDVSIIEQPFIV